MKLKKALQVNLRFKNRVGNCMDSVKNFPLDNDMRCDFNILVNVVENVTRDGYDLFKVDVSDLIVHKDNEYVSISDKQLVNLITDIQDRITW